MAKIIEISDFSAPELDVYARLTENQLLNRAYPKNAMFVAESPLVIGRAMDAGCVPLSFLMEPKHVEGRGHEILARCADDVPVYTAPLEVLTQLTGFHLTRGMLCCMLRPALPALSTLCAASRRVAVLENVMNPTNIGAIFRSAAALGMDAVLLTAAGSDPLYRRAARVSMGTVFQVPWTYLPEDADWQDVLHQEAPSYFVPAMTLTIFALNTSPSSKKTYTLSAEDATVVETLFSIDSMTPVASDSESVCAYQFDIENRSYLLDDSLNYVDVVVRESEGDYTYYCKHLSDAEIESLREIIEAYAE